MDYLKRLLMLFVAVFALSAAVYAEDCHTISTDWFGTELTDGTTLGITTVSATEDVSNALEPYFAQREEDFSAEEGDTIQDAEASAHQELIEQLEERISAEILDAQVSTFVETVEETENGYVVTVYEWTFFDYDDLADGVGGQDTAGFGTEHVLTLEYDSAGTLQIVSDAYTESDVLTGDTAAAYEDGGSSELENTSYASAFYSSYDPVKASVYSNQYVTHGELPENSSHDTQYYNSAYKNFASGGGDCANFVSQCLYAGGLPTDSYWYPYDIRWTYCPSQIAYLKKYGTLITMPSESDILPGSLIYYNSYSTFSTSYYYHVTICVGQNSAGTPVVNGHTYDRYRVPWDYSKEKNLATLQLTSYKIEDMTFTEDTLVALADVTIPVYSHYQSATQMSSLTLSAGETLSVVTTFRLGETLWAAIRSGSGLTSLTYVKVEGSLSLESLRPVPTITVAQTATTNDELAVSISVDSDTAESCTLTISDAEGTRETFTADTADAAFTVNCLDFTPGTLTISVTVEDSAWITLKAETTITLVDAPTAHGTCGESSTWQLDKETGMLTILGSGEVTDASWSRFAGLIQTVVVYPEITSIPESAFDGCTLQKIYGKPEFLAELAEKLGAEYVALGQYVDVFPGAWYYDDVYAATDAGLFNGTSKETFSPDLSMSRGMLVTVLGRMAQVDTLNYISTETPFTDVPENYYYAPYIAWAYSCGITEGTTETTFSPDDPVTREQAATLIYRYLNYYKLELKEAENAVSSFKDADEISDYAVEAVAEMARAGILRGDDVGTVRPKAEIRRSEAAAVLARLLKAVETAEEAEKAA